MWKGWTKKDSLEEFWNGTHLEDEKGKTSKFVDAGGYNWNERAGNFRLGMGRQRGMEKENLGTE